MNALTAADRIIHALQLAGTQYYRLVLLVAPVGGGKNAALREVRRCTEAPLVNVSRELSTRLLELPAKQRPPRVQPLLEEVIVAAGRDTVLLEHLELLFEPSLAQDPLRLLEQLSRTRTLAAAWPGRIEAGHLLYAEPGHPEYVCYPVPDLRVIELPLFP